MSSTWTSVLPYPGVQEQKIKLAMKLGGEYRLKAHNVNTWPKVADELGLDPDQVVRRVATLISVAPSAFAAAASDESIATLGSALPSRLVAAVTKRAKWCQGFL